MQERSIDGEVAGHAVYTQDSMADSYRKLILDRLEKQKQDSEYLFKLFHNYSQLTEKLEKQQTYGPSRSSVSNQDCDELKQVKQEMAELYKSKCQNDQMLINTNDKISDYEKRTRIIVAENESLKAKYKQFDANCAQMETEFQKLKSDNDSLNNERIATITTVNMLTEQILVIEKERVIFNKKIRELKEQQIAYLDQEFDAEEINIDSLDMSSSPVQEFHETDQQVEYMLRDALETNERGFVNFGDSLPSQIEFTMECDVGEINDIHWLTEQTFATGGSDRNITIWKSGGHQGQTRISTLAGSNAAFTRIDYRNYHNLLIASSNDKTVRIWNLNNSRLISTLSGHSDQVTCVKFYQSNSAVSGGSDRVIKIWDLQKERCSGSQFPASKVMDVATNVCGMYSFFATGHLDKKIRLYDGRLMDPVQIIEMESKITSLCATTRGFELLVSTRDNIISLLELRNFQTVSCYSSETYRTSSDFSQVVISSGNEYVVAGSANGTVFIWNKESTSLEKVLSSSSEKPVLSLSWNPTGYGLLSSSKHVVSLWK